MSSGESRAARIGGLLAGDEAQRTAALQELAALAKSEDADRIAVATACIAPLVESVLLADVSHVGSTEAQEAYVVLGSLVLLDPVTVCVPWLQNNRWFAPSESPNTAVGVMLAKRPEELTRDDVMLAAKHQIAFAVLIAKGASPPRHVPSSSSSSSSSSSPPSSSSSSSSSVFLTLRCDCRSLGML
jgi:hypothetical protein